jgi:hypothetical protein
VVQEINPITNKVVEKGTNPVPSFIVVSFVIPLNIQFMITFIRQLKPCLGKR